MMAGPSVGKSGSRGVANLGLQTVSPVLVATATVGLLEGQGGNDLAQHVGLLPRLDEGGVDPELKVAVPVLRDPSPGLNVALQQPVELVEAVGDPACLFEKHKPPFALDLVLVGGPETLASGPKALRGSGPRFHH